jgi:hypothetical protein
LKLSLSLAMIYTFYWFVLRRLTFYTWNRFYLLAYTALCFFIPLINITSVLERNEMINNRVVLFIPPVERFNDRHLPAFPATGSVPYWSVWDVLFIVLVTGMGILVFRLAVQFLSYRKIVRQSTLVHHTGVRYYQVSQKIIPFSFGKSIFINPGLHSEDELKEIVRHEFIHVRQGHTTDIIWAEILCILNWYNPCAWLIRKAIRQNLEFIADCKVLQSGIDKKQYQYLLLKITGNNHFRIASQFNFSSLKKRIAMMNKMKSTSVHLVKFLFILPLMAVLLLAFRNSHKNLPSRERPVPGTTVTDRSMPASYYDTVPPTDSYIIELIINKNKGNTMVIVKDKHKKVIKQMPLTEWDRNKKYNESKYGTIDGVVEDEDHPGLITTDQGSHIYKLKETDTGIKISQYIEVTDDNKATVTEGDNKIHYDLNNKNERKEFEKKYGTIVTLPVAAKAGTTIVSDSGVVAVTSASTMGLTSVSGHPVSESASSTITGNVSVVQSDEPVKAILVENNVIAVFRKNMQEADVRKIEADLKERGYDFKITKTEFKNGRLFEIKGHIAKNNHKQYFSASEFSRLIIADSPEDNDNEHFNFLVEQGKLSVNESPEWQ